MPTQFHFDASDLQAPNMTAEQQRAFDEWYKSVGPIFTLSQQLGDTQPPEAMDSSLLAPQQQRQQMQQDWAFPQQAAPANPPPQHSWPQQASYPLQTPAPQQQGPVYPPQQPQHYRNLQLPPQSHVRQPEQSSSAVLPVGQQQAGPVVPPQPQPAYVPPMPLGWTGLPAEYVYPDMHRMMHDSFRQQSAQLHHRHQAEMRMKNAEIRKLSERFAQTREGCLQLNHSRTKVQEEATRLKSMVQASEEKVRRLSAQLREVRQSNSAGQYSAGQSSSQSTVRSSPPH